MPSSFTLRKLNHRHVDSSVSTNSELIAQVQSGTLDPQLPHLLTASTQTAGRGQYTRSWQSPRGNVYLSLYHPVTAPISGLLSLIIGLELAKMPIIEQLNAALQASNLTPIGVKWANDLGFYPPILNDKDAHAIHYFKKLAGILIEPVWISGKLIGVVMGVGLNVKTAPKLTAQTLEGMSYHALSLDDICDLLTQHQPDNNEPNDIIKPPALTDLYAQIAGALTTAMNTFLHISTEKHSQQPSSYQDLPTMAAFLQEFAQREALDGHYLRVTQEYQGKPVILSGHAAGIDTNGCLQLRQDNGSICALFTGRIDVISHP